MRSLSGLLGVLLVVAGVSRAAVQEIRDAYLVDPATPDPRHGAPLRSNAIPGYRTRRELLKDLASKPWGP